MIRYGAFDDCEVLVDEAAAGILVYKRLGAQWLPTLCYTARNLRVLAEHLSDEISYGRAVALLTMWDLPRDHPLWTLNHKGGRNHFSAD